MARSIYDVLDGWDLLDEESDLSKYGLSDWRDIDRALFDIYEHEFSACLGSSFLGANLTTRFAEGLAPPETIAASVLAFETVWLFDPIYSLVSDAAAEAWNLLPERNADYFGKGPHVYVDWRPLGHQRKHDRREFLLREIPPRIRRLRELRPLFQAGAINFISWERLLLKHRARLKASVDSLRASAEPVVTRHPQDKYNLGFRLPSIRIQLSGDMPQHGLPKGADLHLMDRTHVLLYGLMNTLISSQSGAVLTPELQGDSELYEFVMSGLNPTPARATVSQRIELPRLSEAVWDDLVLIRKDSAALATLRELVRQAATAEEAAVLGSLRARLDGAAEEIQRESGLRPFFKAGSVRLGMDAIKGVTSRLAGTVTAGAVVGGAAGGLAGAIIGAAAGGVGGAATGFLLELATRAFDKTHQVEKARAELFVRISQKLDSSSER